MGKIFGCCTILLSALLLVPNASPGQQQNNKKQQKNKDTVTKEETTPQDYASLSTVKDFTAKVSEINLNSGVMTLTIEYQYYAPNPNQNAIAKGDQKMQKLQQQLQNDYNKILTTRNAAQKQQLMAKYQADLQRLQQQGAINLQNAFVIAKASKDVELNTVEKLKVARSKLEAKYNDEGELIKYTADQLKKMKSPDITGAYSATPEDIRVGQVVKLYLNPPKKDPKKTTTDKSTTEPKKSETTDPKGASGTLGDILSKQSTDAKGQTGEDGRTVFPDRPQIRMVLIVDNPGVPELTDPLKK